MRTTKFEAFQSSCGFETKVSNFRVHTLSRVIKNKRMNYIYKNKENGNLKFQQPCSCVRSLRPMRFIGQTKRNIFLPCFYDFDMLVQDKFLLQLTEVT